MSSRVGGSTVWCHQALQGFLLMWKKSDVENIPNPTLPLTSGTRSAESLDLKRDSEARRDSQSPSPRIDCESFINWENRPTVDQKPHIWVHSQRKWNQNLWKTSAVHAYCWNQGGVISTQVSPNHGWIEKKCISVCVCIYIVTLFSFKQRKSCYL